MLFKQRKYLLLLISCLFTVNSTFVYADPDKAIELVSAILKSRSDYKVNLANYFDNPHVPLEEKKIIFKELNEFNPDLPSDFSFFANDLHSYGELLTPVMPVEVSLSTQRLADTLAKFPTFYPNIQKNLAQLKVEKMYLSILSKLKTIRILHNQQKKWSFWSDQSDVIDKIEMKRALKIL